MGRLGTVSSIALVALSVFAATASADPLSMRFTEARANVGVQLADEALFGGTATAPLEAQIDPGNGSISAGALAVPQFSTFITDPIDAGVTVDFEIGVVSGSFDQATGALTLQGTAGGTLKANEKECTVSTTPSPLVLSTAGNSGGASPRSGAPFSAGLAGPGAIAGQWTDMQATPVDPGPGGDTFFCEDVEKQIGGPGGIWLDQKVNVAPPLKPQATDSGAGTTPPPPPPPAPACVVPKLAGRTLARAKPALKAAGCTLGKVGKPKPRRGQGQPRLVVKASNPAAGASLAAGGKVHLRLGPKS